MAGEGRAVRRIGCRHGASGEGGRQSDKELPMTRSESEANPSAALLRDCYDAPNETVQKKILTRLDKHAKAFIGLSPLVMLATAGPEGADCSPRGDAPGFVRVEDDSTLLLPDRRGNNLIDSLRNVVQQPSVGLLFLVPGINETLRVNGSADRKSTRLNSSH